MNMSRAQILIGLGVIAAVLITTAVLAHLAHSNDQSGSTSVNYPDPMKDQGEGPSFLSVTATRCASRSLAI